METVKGLAKVLKKLKDLGEKAEIGIDQSADQAVREIAVDARSRAPKNLGKLQQSIVPLKIGDLRYETRVGELYGVFVEFGTGAKVRVPPELNDLANRARSNPSGSFENGLQSIKDWCKRKGIPETAAYPIFVSILNKGLTPQPFLYPAFVKGRDQYLKNLQNLLKQLTK